MQSPAIHVIFGFDENLDGTLNDYLWSNRAIGDMTHDIKLRFSRSVNTGNLMDDPEFVAAVEAEGNDDESVDIDSIVIRPVRCGGHRGGPAGDDIAGTIENKEEAITRKGEFCGGLLQAGGNVYLAPLIQGAWAPRRPPRPNNRQR